ncbi:MAG TPA: hypothetical protein VEU11_07345 [Terriglobales bacterium]|nr:hypothetical protein [Terriglobales bacterium]
MNPRSALVVALVAAGLVYRPSAPPSPSRARQGTQTAAAGGNTVVYDTRLEVENWPREKMHEFFTTRGRAKEKAERAVCRLPGNTEVSFLIATVPDPQNSHYPVMFDRFVESIRRASEDSGYTLDRFWLPWDAESGPPDADWLKREHHQDWQATKQDYPGILVFHSGTEKVLGVLLIGENPISGINKQQFVNALGVITHFKSPVRKSVAVLGPTFSGSIESLGIAMRDLSGNTGIQQYDVITGSATAADNKRHLLSFDCELNQQGAATCCGPGHPNITYYATIENDADAFDRFFKYLDPDFADGNGTQRLHEVELNRVAILAESGSGYARQLISKAEKRAAERQLKGQLSYLILDYPMEISRVRQAYEDDPELSVLSSSGAAAGGPPRQGLQIRLKDSHGAEDSIPGFSTELTPVSQEAALLNTLATISREHIEYVGIIATDILDSIFLGRMLRQHCPDVRLFIFDSDLVYSHIAQNYAFQGMMMVTSYPLFAANQGWTKSWEGQRKKRQFSSASAEGVYNAGLMLLDRFKSKDEKSKPPVEYAAPYLDDNLSSSECPRPALWLAVVGRDGLWPLTTLEVNGQEELWAMPGGKTPGDFEDKKWTAIEGKNVTSDGRPWLAGASRGWELGFWLLTLFCALFAAGVIYSNRKPDNGKTIRHGRLSMLRVGADKHRLAVRLGLSAAAGVLLIAYGSVVAVEISYLKRNAVGVPSLAFFPVTPFPMPLFSIGDYTRAAFCMLIPALVLAAAFWCWRPGKPRWMAVSGLASVAAAVLFSVAVHSHPLSLFYAYRFSHVGSGVTPVVPTVFLSAALVWYAFAHLNRIRLCRAQPAGLPSFKNDTYLRSVTQIHSNLTKALEHRWLGKWSWVAVAAFALSLLWLNPLRVGSIEWLPFEWPYTAGLCVLYGGLLFGCVRYLQTWFDLRRILRMLERHPIREAFRRLPKELSPARVWRWGGGGQTYLTLAESIDRLRGLVNNGFDRASDFDYAAQLSHLEANARILMARDAYARPVKATTIHQVHQVLTVVSTQLVRVLESSWSKGVAAEAQPQAMAAAAGSAGTPPPVQRRQALSPTERAEEFVALRFVSMIRYATLHLKNLLEFVAGALILAIVSLNSYPFEPHHAIITAISLCFFALSIVFLTAIVQMNRNTIMSYLADSKPGKLDGNLLHILSFGALPLVTVLAAQFPAVGGFLFSWVKPALETLR